MEEALDLLFDRLLMMMMITDDDYTLTKLFLPSHKLTFMLFMCFEIILLLMVFQGRVAQSV